MTRFTDSPYERMMTRRPEGGKETSRPLTESCFVWRLTTHYHKVLLTLKNC